MIRILLSYSLYYCMFLHFSFLLCAQQDEESVSGKIYVIKNDNLINIKAEVVNESTLFKDELSYKLMALKKGRDGNYATNNQSGEFSLQPNEKKEVSTIMLSLSSSEELKVYLFIKEKNKLIVRDTLFIPSKKIGAKKVQQIDESTFFIKGLVIEEVTTKIGKDFHDLFYQEYLLSGLQYPFIIKIKEKPGLRRTTVVTVKANETKVFEFMTQPGAAFLQKAVKTTLVKLRLFNKQRNRLLSYKI